ncbi:NADP-dependent oxidoreductase [Amnibacterium endophyticum]|uniref:NADP-dependent oxidoreductase n=1 Tax=Amnibacterium endophyticum TaxID=2109337 RepID=A0ABW4LGZ8_9MICO
MLVAVAAVGMNPADYKHIAPGQDPRLLPLALGFEVAGTIAALGSGTSIATGSGAVGDEVIAAQISGGYATHVVVSAADVFAKPERLSMAEAANLIVAGSTAAELVDVTGVGPGDTVLIHGASGAVGTSVAQQAALVGARVIGTASEQHFAAVRAAGAQPVAYGDGLESRVRQLAPEGITAAIDTVGTDEAIDVSIALVADRARIATTAAFARAARAGFTAVGARNPRSAPFRAGVRGRVIGLAASGDLRVPVSEIYPFSRAPEALARLMGHHPGGKLALAVEPPTEPEEHA